MVVANWFGKCHHVKLHCQYFYTVSKIEGVITLLFYFQIITTARKIATGKSQKGGAMRAAGPPWGPAKIWAQTSASTPRRGSKAAEPSLVATSAMETTRVRPSRQYAGLSSGMLWAGTGLYLTTSTGTDTWLITAEWTTTTQSSERTIDVIRKGAEGCGTELANPVSCQTLFI